MTQKIWFLDPDRFFDPDPVQRSIAQDLFKSIAELPIVSPHGHVPPELFSDEHASFGTPTDLLIIPDHYVFRMLYSQGIPLEALGVPRTDGGEVEQDHRKIWQTFADNFYLFRGTPSGVWLAQELIEVFGIEVKLNSDTAQTIYDQIAEKLTSPAFRPRALFDSFNIEVLCTTDPATSQLEHHKAIRESGWNGKIFPTFRPDSVVNLLTPNWSTEIATLSNVTGIDITSYPAFIEALEKQRAFFKEAGATATDQAAVSAYTEELSHAQAEEIFQKALKGTVTPGDADLFMAHMIMESARMSVDDGLVMQLHIGSIRNHNQAVFDRFGPDKGCDIPARTEFTYSLQPLLNKYGNNPQLTMLIFTLDETTYARELAPLAGHYPAVKLGPPWWFHDSLNGINRYFDQVMETAGLYNTSGFNDDTRAFPSIPARHDVWRRASANWLAGLVARGMVDLDEAYEMIIELTYGLAKTAYNL